MRQTKHEKSPYFRTSLYMERVKLLVRYESEGKPYIYLPTWTDHQRIRNKKRKYPVPPSVADRCLSNDSQLTADCLP